MPVRCMGVGEIIGAFLANFKNSILKRLNGRVDLRPVYRGRARVRALSHAYGAGVAALLVQLLRNVLGALVVVNQELPKVLMPD